MTRKMLILLLFLPFTSPAISQVLKEGRAVLKEGDTLRGEFRYKEGHLFTGVDHLPPDSDRVFLPSDSLERLRLEGEHYRSFLIPEEQAGVRSFSLLVREVEGKMSLYRGHYRHKSCTCQDHSSVKEGVLLVKEGGDRVHLVQKNQLLDRIKNAEEAASAFLPYEGLMKKVRERDLAFSEIGEAVQRFNERSKDGSKP